MLKARFIFYIKKEKQKMQKQIIPVPLLAHVVTAIILVSILPSYLLVPILTYLTYESYWANFFITTVQFRIEEFFKSEVDFKRRRSHERSDSIGEWVKTHYDTLKRILEKEN
jgi:hypothetical protein